MHVSRTLGSHDQVTNDKRGEWSHVCEVQGKSFVLATNQPHLHTHLASFYGFDVYWVDINGLVMPQAQHHTRT